jgi:hypothetical protein
MPVLGEDDRIEQGSHRVDGSHDLVPVLDRQGSALAEIVLQIHDDERASLLIEIHDLPFSERVFSNVGYRDS